MLALEWNLDDAKQAWQEEAREQGELIRAEKIASNLIRRGWSFDEIREDTGLSLQCMKELAKDAATK